MKRITELTGHFLTTNTAWVFFTFLLLVSYVMMVEAGRYTWEAYLSHSAYLCLVFAPVLVFSGCRRWIRKYWEAPIYSVLWLLSFVVYPLLAGIIQFHYPDALLIITPTGMDLPESFVLTAGAGLLICELTLQSNDFLLEKARTIKWFKKNQLERNILLLLLLLAMIAAAMHTFRSSPLNFSSFIEKTPTFVSTTCQLLLVLGTYYFFYFINHYLLIPKLLKKKGLLYYGFGVTATILIFYPLLTTSFHVLPAITDLNLISYEQPREMIPSDRGGAPFLLMLLTMPIIVGIEWYRQISEIATLEKEKSETELNLLKQQFSPHFFFNTLNNLYALSLVKDQRTPEVILQLSDLMRYVIYKGREEKVPLIEEVQYLEDYIRLEQIRLSKRLDFRFEKNISDDQVSVPPLLFMIFVENAFKHGITPAEEEGFLHIYLESDGRKLVFLCENSVEEKIVTGPGIGLSNLRRRLSLYFPGRHQLTTTELPHSYKAVLKLDLA